jgi:hypothetical protein
MVAASFASLIRCGGVVVDEMLLLVGVPGLAMLVAVTVVLLTLVVVEEMVLLLTDVVADETVVLLGFGGGAVN